MAGRAEGQQPLLAMHRVDEYGAELPAQEAHAVIALPSGSIPGLSGYSGTLAPPCAIPVAIAIGACWMRSRKMRILSDSKPPISR